MEKIGNKKALRVSNHFHCRTGLARSDKGINLKKRVEIRA
jgi:hypothetical protein